MLIWCPRHVQLLCLSVRVEEGSEPDYTVWDQLVATATQALGGFLSAHAAYYHRGGARELIDQVGEFCQRDDAPKRLQKAGRQPEDAPIIEALLTLHSESARRRQERTQQRDVAEQGAATERTSTSASDRPAWEF